MGRAIVVRTDYTSGDVRRVAQRVKNAAQARRLLCDRGGARRQFARTSGEDRRHGPSDAAGLGDPVQRAGAGRSRQQIFAGRTRQANRRA